MTRRSTIFGLSITVLFLITAVAAAQSPQGVITGVVIDSETRRPIPSATVELRDHTDSSLVTGAITDDVGAFRLENLRAGTYDVRIRFVGYSIETRPEVTIDAARHDVDLGRLLLKPDRLQLDEVEISAERAYMQVGIDKTVYNVQNQPVMAGASAQDVLENVPSIEVDIDGNISLRGSQNVAIYLNGKPAPMNGDALTSFLAGLAADDIDRVEVIPNPSARYDPEGMSGIINIVLSKNEDLGWGGGLSGSAGTRQSYNGSANVHYGKGPMKVFANYSLRHGTREQSGDRFRENRFMDPITYLEQEMLGEGGGFSNTFNANVDYDLGSINTMSFSAMFSDRARDNEELNRYFELDTSRNLTRRYDRVSDGERSDFSMDYRLSFQRIVIPREHELRIEAQFETDVEKDLESHVQRLWSDAISLAATSSDQQIVEKSENEREASLEVDYRRQLGEDVYMEAGYKGDLEWLDSRLYSESADSTGAFSADILLNNTFDYAEQIHAVYGVVGAKRGPFGVQAGLRLEEAITGFDQQTLSDSFDHSYFSFFPSVHATFEPIQGNSFKASYSKRVRRPNTWQLNPFGDFDDPTFIRVGNPYLEPEYTHSFEAGYSRLGEAYTASFTPYFRHSVDEISWHEELRDDGVTVVTFENFATEDSYGLELIGSLTLGEWLKANGSLNAYKQVTNASNVASELSSDALGYRTRLSLTATLIPGLNLQVTQFYRSPMDVPGGRIASFTMTDVALQHTVLANRATLNLRARDVFNSMGFEVRRESEGYYQEFRRQPNRRELQLTFRYTFGRQQDRERQRDGSDEQPAGDQGYGGEM